MEDLQKCSRCPHSYPLSAFLNPRGKPTVMCATCRVKSAKYTAIQRQRMRDVNIDHATTGVMACRSCCVRKSFVENFINVQTGCVYARCVECRNKDTNKGARRRKRLREANIESSRASGTRTCMDCRQVYHISEKFVNSKGVACSCCAECRIKSSIHKRTTVDGKIGVYKAAAKKQHITWNLSNDQCTTLFHAECTYCGSKASGNGNGLNGIDRTNSNIGYVETNVVSCCPWCNASKKTLDPKTFILRCVHLTSVVTNGEGMHGNLWPDKIPGAYAQYKGDAKRRKYEFDMTKEQYLDLVERPCIYCRRVISSTNKSGIDRRDPSKGYIDGNMDPCCSECNFMKGPSTVDEFHEMVTRIAEGAHTILGKIPADIPQCLDSLTQFRKKDRTEPNV